jgi:hypothetical protein
MDPTAKPKVKTMKGGVRTHSLTRSTLKIKGHVGVLGWGLKIVTNKLITHMDLHKLNNKLVSA